MADVAGAETASPTGGPAFVAAADDAAADAMAFAVQGAMSDGSLRDEISRPIYGNFEDADTTALCWGGSSVRRGCLEIDKRGSVLGLARAGAKKALVSGIRPNPLSIQR